MTVPVHTDWLLAAAAALLLLVLLLGLRRVVAARLARSAAAGAGSPLALLGRLAARTSRLVLALAIGLLAWLGVAPDAPLAEWGRTLLVGVLLVQAGLWGTEVIGHLLQRRQLAAAPEHDAESTATLRLIGLLARISLYALLLLLFLDNIPGVKLTALLAGLGIGGIAVALAMQNILSDLFASLSISLDRPFIPGDFIIVGEFLGTVEDVGLKTTRVRSLSGEQLIFPNADLLNSRIRNYRRMEERRVAFGFGVTYQTPADALRAIPEMVRAIVESQEAARFDRAHFKRYGESSLEFEVVYYVEGADYTLYMDIQQAINLALFERFDAEGVEFAYPTRTVFVKSAANECA